MKVLNLRCSHEHGFEGWFGSEAEFQDQLARGLVTCPLCNDSQIKKMPSAPRLNLSGEGRSARSAESADGPNVPATAAPATQAPAQMSPQQAAVWASMRQALAKAEDVGERFADEARRMHQGEAEHRQIRGRASVADAMALLEEGVPVLPVPDALKETLQ